MSKRFLLQNTAIAAIIALVATIMAASPVVGQVGETVGGAASDDAAFAEPGEAVDIDVVANDDGMDDFDDAPTLLVVDQPDGGVFSTALDEDGIAVLLFSANVTFTGITKGKYRACWGNSCDNAEVTVYVGGEACSIAGTNGPDTLTGTSGDDVICGLSGADTIDGKGGDDLIFGGNGKDTLRGSGGADEIYGGRGDDTIFGGNGADKLFGRKGADTISGNGGADEIHGNRGADIISGGNGDDVLFGGRGQDAITGGDGDDVIRGRRGADDLRGNANADQIFGGRGDDSLRGNGGDDLLNGGNGTDSLNGGNGDDICTRGETVTNCENDPVEPGTDTDGDGIPDDEDPDDDNDGTPDDQDAFPLDPNETTDTDGDGVGDNADPDIDGDGVDNGDDAFPLDLAETTDTDGDGTGNNADTDDDDDTYADDVDAFPLDPLEWLDTDGDGVGNNADLDDDGDGIPDVDDDDPLTPIDPTDTDGDGIPDAIDPDIDNDGIPNELDDFPNDDSESSDTDGDGIGDNTDPDADNDGVLNEDDAFPFDDGETVDSDGGGLGDNADPDDDDDGVFDDVDVFPNDGTEWEDTDGDGTGNNADTNDDDDSALDVDDAFPLDPTETLDTDFDGIGNNADPDDDNDGVLDGDDAFPLDSLVSKDTDGDGIGDLLDDDNDNDGALDLADAFPNDPTETLDTDLDGIGNNADPDDDGDTFNDDVDAFPLDPNEWSDLDGNGVGDNADLVADLDGDGLPDGADPDIDGDLVDNVDDAFPLDPTEWADSDGDGIGDNEDTDDDDDGVPDDIDLLPNDPNTGADSDGDGTPDTYDLDPNSADEPRFQVVTQEPSGAATTIVSDGLILEDEVVITEEPVAPENAISTVAASEIVDFTIDGPFTEFETARITIPIDPTLAQQPDPVEVWWFNEEYGLWVPDGTDLQVDPTNATVSVTVDHFSKFVALTKGSNPFVIRPGADPAECIDTGVDVLFLIDDSGSNEYDYIIDGERVSASDPEVVIPPVDGNPGSVETRERVLAVRDVLLALNEATDRVAVSGFTNGVTSIDYVADTLPGYGAAFERARLIADSPDSGGIDLPFALSVGRSFLESQDQERAKAIVVLTDGDVGGFDFEDVRNAVGDDVFVHVVGIGDSPNPDLATVTQAGGGVYAPSRSNSQFDVLLQRINELNVDFGTVDFDGDLLTDCDELRGLMTTEALEIGPSSAAGQFRPAGWVKTDPRRVDSDGDLLWDSEELIGKDLRSDPGIAFTYGPIIEAGFPIVYQVRGDTEDESPLVQTAKNDPVNSQGVITRDSFVPSLGSIAVREARLARLNKLGELRAAVSPSSTAQSPPTESVDFDALRTEWVDLLLEELTIEWLLGDRSSSFFFDLASYDDLNPTMLSTERFERLITLYSVAANLRDKNQYLDAFDQPLVEALYEVEQDWISADPSDYYAIEVQRDPLVADLARRLLRITPASGDFAPDTIDEMQDALNALQANYFITPDDPGADLIPLDTYASYRLLKLRYTDPDLLALRLNDLRVGLGKEVGSAPTETPASIGIDPDDFDQLVLEERAARDLLNSLAIFDNMVSPFFDPDEAAAYQWIVGQMANQTSLTEPFRLLYPEEILDPDELLPLEDDGVVAVDQRSMLWGEFTQAQSGLNNDEFAALRRIWDDVALSLELGSGWARRAEFSGGRNLDPDDELGLSLTDFAAGRFQRLNLQTEVLYGNEYIDDNHPGIITNEDIERFSYYMLVRQLAPANFQLLSGDADDTVTQEDVDEFNRAFVTILGKGDNVTAAEAEAFFSAARKLKLVDDVPEISDVIKILEAIGITLGVSALIVGTGGAAGQVLLALALVADTSATVLTFSQGNVTEGIVGAVFIVAGTKELADAVKLVGRRGQAATTAVSFVTNSVPVDAGVVASRLKADGFVEAGESLSKRTSTATSSPELDLAYIESVTRPKMIQDLADEGATPQQITAVLDAYFDDLASVLDNPSRVNDFVEIIKVNDGAGEAVARWGDKVFDANGNLVDDLVEAGAVCRAANSFSGGTLVAMADGTAVSIAKVQIGDQVLAYDFDTGETVSRDVTATLPHTDWLLDAHLSDGSVLEVTEDHRFWSITDNGWVELQDLDPTDRLLTPEGATVTVDYLDWNAGQDALAFDLTVSEEHNFFVAAHATAEPVLVHNQTPGFFCGVPVDDPEVAADLVDLNRRLDDTGDSDAVGSALTRLSENLADEGLDAAGVDRILNVIVDVERRGDTDLAETMARNLAADSRATEGIVRRELDLAANGSANAGVYSERVLGDSAYAEIWGAGAQFENSQDDVLKRLQDPEYWNANSDVDAKEFVIAERLEQAGRSVVNNPLEALPDGRPRGDAFVDGVEADFKTLGAEGTSDRSVRSNITSFARDPQGKTIIVDSRTRSATFDRELVVTNITEAIALIDDPAREFVLRSDDFDRIDVLVGDGSIVSWTPGGGLAG